MKRDNHYVPQFLLRNFSMPSQPTRLLEYRLLVEDERVPEWCSRAKKSAAQFRDLYTIVHNDQESDATETWLEKEFETPAASAIDAVLAQSQLGKDATYLLSRLFAAQIVRTPKFYVYNRPIWAQQMDEQVKLIAERIERDKPQLDLRDESPVFIDAPGGFPLRVRVQLLGDTYSCKPQGVTGRKLWMWAIHHALRVGGPLTALEQHQWTVLLAPKGMPWPITDNPAVSVFSRPDGSRNYAARWDEPGARLMLPLSPKHLIFFRVGSLFREQYTSAHPILAEQIRLELADAAYRSIFGHTEHADLARYKPRKADREQFLTERRQWESFAEEQTQAERY